jgi:hypothetical protein
MAEQAQPGLDRVVEAIGETHDPATLGSLEQAAAALAPRLTAEQAQNAFARVLDRNAQTADPDARRSLGGAAAALAPRLTAQQAQHQLERVRSALGWSASSEEARQWAKALAALLARFADAKSASHAIVEAMKVPITAGKPSDELLAELQRYLPSLPGPKTGLRANLDWLHRNDPSIDLVSRAACPPPTREQLHCPAQVGVSMTPVGSFAFYR